MQLFTLIFRTGSGLCHQLPERSYFFQGIQLPLCARCSGIYLGFVLAFLFLTLIYKNNQRRGGFSVGFYIVGILFATAMAIDGFSSYLGFRETTNLIRLLTGGAFGVALAGVVYVMAVDVLLKTRSDSKVLDTVPALLGFIAMVPLTLFVLFGVSSLSVYYGYVLLGFSVLFVFTAVTSVLMGLLPVFENKVSSVRSAIPALFASIVGAALILFGTYQLQLFIRTLL